jgi:asparagine synthase (glutamine-hydrolysing)
LDAKFIKSKEAYYYWNHFKNNHKNNFNVIPYYWLPEWSGNINEPSARVLKVYN